MLRMVDILASLGRNLQATPADDEAPKPFRFRGFIYPGSYLLSRDLSSDYHRRADVSLPGSEWDRVGPSGYDHQASVCCVSFLLQPLARVVMFTCFGALCSVVVACCFLCLRLCFQQADIRVARGFISFLCVLLSLKVIKRFIKGLSPKV